MPRTLLAVCTAAVFVLGCSQSPHPLAHVSGKITVNGKPAAKLAVTFQPILTTKSNYPPPSSGAMTDPDGRYTLKVIGTELAGTSGALVGKHNVYIIHHIERDPFDDGPPKTKPAIEIPVKYSTPGTLTFEVPSGGSSKADFELKVP